MSAFIFQHPGDFKAPKIKFGWLTGLTELERVADKRVPSKAGMQFKGRRLRRL